VDVRWERLEHNYGVATDIPDLLQAVRDPDPEVAAEALSTLGNHLYHQGGWVCSAATAALPFLLELAKDPDVAGRAEIVELIGLLGREALEVSSVDAGWPSAWQSVWPEVLDLLPDDDPEVRQEAIQVVGGCAVSADAIPVLRRQWETDRLDVVLAVGEVVERTGDADGEAWLRGLLEHDDPHVMVAAVLALAENDPQVPVNHVSGLVSAIRDGDSRVWESSGAVGSASGVMRWVGRTLEHDPVARTTFTLAFEQDTDDPEQRVDVLAQMGELLSQWRSPAPSVIPALIERLDDPVVEVRSRAVHLLASLRTGADHLAEKLDDQGVRSTRSGETVGMAAAWGLAWMKDSRCLPRLTDQIASGDFGTTSNHYGRDFYLPALPGIHEVLSPLAGHAETLLPAIRARLRSADVPDERRAFAKLLGDWRLPSTVPDLIDLLDTDAWSFAAEALGTIGAPAAEDQLARIARDRNSEVAAWAHYRACGSTELALPILADDLTSTNAVRMLADLGPAAAQYADQLAGLAEHPGNWTAVTAAYAHWRITGEPAVAVNTLVRTVEPLSKGTYHPVALPAVRYLGEIGRPALAAAPLLRQAVTTDKRLAHFGSWRSFTEDEAVRTAIAVTLELIEEA
jgi:HEAT repeat protein